MKTCNACGNQYDKCFDVILNAKTYTFDSFECAINSLAPKCIHCDCKIIGHGVEQEDKIYCCANCAKMSGTTNLRDRA